LIGRIRTRLASEAGYSLVELVTVVAILSVVLGGLTTVFVSASNGELDMNRRFQAQQSARLAMDKLRQEIHCATSVTPSGSSTAVAITLPAACPTSGGFTTIRWCAVAPPGALAGRYALYRSTAATCGSSTGVKWADYLTSQNVFTYTPQSSQSLSNLAVALVVNLRRGSTVGQFKLQDRIVLRNSTRTCIVGSPSPPC
jgi:prepilin-type N-terminal cleavage/methylation domain-containing protein